MDTSSTIKTAFYKEAVKGGMCKEANSFVWEIENFDVIRTSKELIERQKFNFVAGASVDLKTEWAFNLILSESNKANQSKPQKWIGCFLELKKVPNGSNSVLASWQLKIKDTHNHSYFFFKTFMEHEYKVGIGSGYSCVLLQDLDVEDFPLKNGSLIMKLKMHLYAPQPSTMTTSFKTYKDATSIVKKYKPKFIQKLQKDFANLLTCPSDGSNVHPHPKIVVGDNKQFNIAVNVLSARSPVFKRMFELKMIENATGIVRITDISSKTMSVLLSFMYTGKLESDWRHPDVITELVYAAAKYQLPDLLQFLDEVVGKVYTKDNAGKLINLAKKLFLKKAENDLWEFVKKNVTSLDDMITITRDADRSFYFL